MARVAIDDPDDPRVASYRHLKATNLTRDSGLFVVEGEKLFDRLRESPFPLASVLAAASLAPVVAPRVPEGVPLYVIDDAKIEAIVGYNFHRGVIACGRRRPSPDVAALAKASDAGATFVVCPRIDNPENLGAIVRIADVFGAGAVLVGGRCPDPFSRRVLRVSMGSVLRVPVVEPGDPPGALGLLRREGFTAVASVVDPAAEPLGDFRRGGRVALLLGCEGHGLDDDWLARSDRRVTIPMRPGAESLNVAVAAGVLLHHLTTRGAGPPLESHPPKT